MNRYGYADPPYMGQAKKHYGKGAREVDHRLLIAHLCAEFPDGWALSCSRSSIQRILPLCPDAVRIAAWVKPFASFKPGVNPAYAWEPVLFMGGRKRDRKEPTVRDWCSANITLKRGTHGAKPDGFCFWLFDLLGMQAEDEFFDLFPGSGSVMDAWKRYCGQTRMNYK